jgi:hypothetical protein
VFNSIRDRSRLEDPPAYADAIAESLATVNAKPSKSHVRRLLRDHEIFHDPAKPAVVESERLRLLRHQLDVKARMVAAFANSRTTGVAEPEEAIRFIRPASREELHP